MAVEIWHFFGIAVKRETVISLSPWHKRIIQETRSTTTNNTNNNNTSSLLDTFESLQQLFPLIYRHVVHPKKNRLFQFNKTVSGKNTFQKVEIIFAGPNACVVSIAAAYFLSDDTWWEISLYKIQELFFRLNAIKRVTRRVLLKRCRNSIGIEWGTSTSRTMLDDHFICIRNFFSVAWHLAVVNQHIRINERNFRDILNKIKNKNPIVTNLNIQFNCDVQSKPVGRDIFFSLTKHSRHNWKSQLIKMFQVYIFFLPTWFAYYKYEYLIFWWHSN